MPRGLDRRGIGLMTTRALTPARRSRGRLQTWGPSRSGTSTQRDPVRSRQQMPFNTRLSSACGTPRGLSDGSGWMIDHWRPVNS